MPTVFFSYSLHADTDAAQFERQILTDVAPRALAEESVQQWLLHRVTPWPGASEDAPDYVCVVDVGDLRSWSAQAAGSIAESHGDLGGLVARISMVVSEDVQA